MTAFIAFWPDSSISVLSYPSGHSAETYESWLYDDLDETEDPSFAKVFRLPSGFHIKTGLDVAVDGEGKQSARLHVTQFHDDGKRPKRLAWSPDAPYRRILRWRMRARDREREEQSQKYVAEFAGGAGNYPPVPPAVYSIEEVRKMEPFSGIYVAVNKTTGSVQYVGKSRDVTGRVSSKRPELEGCQLAVIKMAEQEIHFAEFFYISTLRPTHNWEGRQSREQALDH